MVWEKELVARGSERRKAGGVLVSRRCGGRELTSVLRAKLYLSYIEFDPAHFFPYYKSEFSNEGLRCNFLHIPFWSG